MYNRIQLSSNGSWEEVMKQREMEGKRGQPVTRDGLELMKTVQQLENWPLKDIWPKSLEPVDSKTKFLAHTCD